MTADGFLLLGALGLSSAAAVADVQRRRIPNRLTYPGILLGMALRSALFGWRGLLGALAGCLFAGGVVFLFYSVRAMGAGDVKLLAAIGSLAGVGHSCSVLVATAICGGVLAVVVAVLNRRMLQTLRNLAVVAGFHVRSGWQVHPQLNLENPSALRMPYGLAIAAGTLYTVMASLAG